MSDLLTGTMLHNCWAFAFTLRQRRRKDKGAQSSIPGHWETPAIMSFIYKRNELLLS